MKVGGARPPPLITFTLTTKVGVYAPAEWADTLTLFHLYQYVYSVPIAISLFSYGEDYGSKTLSFYRVAAVNNIEVLFFLPFIYFKIFTTCAYSRAGVGFGSVRQMFKLIFFAQYRYSVVPLGQS